jgi:uncharacterized BrkB/YihY/UPF0761 family membrane protein
MATATRSRPDAIRDLGRRAAEIAETRVPGGSAVAESLARERAAGSGLLAGGVAYRFFIWLVPFGLVLAGIASFWADADPESLESMAKRFGIAGAAAASARAAFETEAHSRWYLLAVGLVLLVWSGTSAVRALRIAYALAWADRLGKLRRPIYASLLFAGVAVGGIVLGLAAQWVRHNAGRGWGLIATLALLVVYLGAATGVMNLLPHGGAPWTALWPGVVLVAVGQELMHVLVTFYLAPKLERSPELYGSLGAATVVLLWLYLTARLFVSAAFLNATLWDRRNRT